MTFRAKNPNDFDKILKQLAKKYPHPKFKPGYFYNEPGDMIEVYLENVSYYAKWINRDVTVYLAQDDNRVVGLSVHGIKKQVLHG